MSTSQAEHVQCRTYINSDNMSIKQPGSFTSHHQNIFHRTNTTPPVQKTTPARSGNRSNYQEQGHPSHTLTFPHAQVSPAYAVLLTSIRYPIRAFSEFIPSPVRSRFLLRPRLPTSSGCITISILGSANRNLSAAAMLDAIIRLWEAGGNSIFFARAVSP